jgi:hypothetical protein
MFEKLSESSGNIIGVKLAGILTDEDYKYFVPELEKIISAHSKIRLLLLTAYPQKFKPKAAWDDLVFWIKHIKNIERLAIVGQKEWEKWIELLEKPFIRTEVKYYSASCLQDAWSWLRS